jgi:hypothetical protein
MFCHPEAALFVVAEMLEGSGCFVKRTLRT